jgi:predicted RecB family nuclease
MEDHETVAYLLADDGPLFDLQKPVLKSLVLPLQGYGLKNICKHPDLVNFQWQDDHAGSQWSVVQFNQYLAETDLNMKAKLKADILRYNRDDVTATRPLYLSPNRTRQG